VRKSLNPERGREFMRNAKANNLVLF
jgi:hypothetical protein